MPTLQPTKRQQTSAAPPYAKKLRLLAKILTSADAKQRQVALQAVRRVGQPGEHQALADHLIQRLLTGKVDVQHRAQLALASLGEPAVRALFQALRRSPSPDKRALSIKALGLVARGLPDPERVSVLRVLHQLFSVTWERVVVHALAEAVALIREAEAAASSARPAGSAPAREGQTAAPGQRVPASKN
jgi:hypothetical protein